MYSKRDENIINGSVLQPAPSDPNKKALNNNVNILGQTNFFQSLYEIEGGLMIGINQHKQKVDYPTTGTLLHINGCPVNFPLSVAKIITKQLNIQNKGEIHWYNNPKGHITLNFKLKKNELFSGYIEKKISEINTQIMDLFYLVGITKTKRFSKRQSNKKSSIVYWKMDVLMACLQHKKNVANILAECFKRRKNLQEMVKQINNKKDEQVSVDIIQVLPQKNEELQQNPCIYLKQLVQISETEDINKSQKFDLLRNTYMIRFADGSQQIKVLLKKTIKESLATPLKYKARAKLRREIQIIKRIKYGKEFFPSYFLPQQQYKNSEPGVNPDAGILQQAHYLQSDQLHTLALYVEEIPSNLAFYIANDIFDFKGFLTRFAEIVQAVQALHMSGIVHRDLKPQNIMISENSKKKVKIIDFSDSALMNEPYKSEISNNLGCSLPYSPFECAFSNQHGINSPAIDIWSLGIILYQFFYKQVPNLYVNGTRLEQFMEQMSNNRLTITVTNLWYKKGFLGYLQQSIQAIIKNCLILLHYQRIGIDLIQQIVRSIFTLIQQMESIVQGNRQEKSQKDTRSEHESANKRKTEMDQQKK